MALPKDAAEILLGRRAGGMTTRQQLLGRIRDLFAILFGKSQMSDDQRPNLRECWLLSRRDSDKEKQCRVHRSLLFVAEHPFQLLGPFRDLVGSETSREHGELSIPMVIYDVPFVFSYRVVLLMSRKWRTYQRACQPVPFLASR
jgi:hypothetical protein